MPHADMESVLARRLRSLESSAAKHALASEVLQDLGAKLDKPVVELLGAHLTEVHREQLPDTANAAYLQTCVLAGGEPLLAAWRRYFTLQAGRDPFDLLAFARALFEAAQPEEAVLELRKALEQSPPYNFFARAEKLVAKLAAPGAVASNVRQCRIAILGSSTTSLLVPVLRALCLRDRITAEIYEAPYGSIDQEILDPASGLAAFKPSIIWFVSHWRDLQLDAITSNEAEWIERYAASRQAFWTRLTESFNCHILQPAFDLPASESYGYLSAARPGGRTHIIERLNQRLRDIAPPNVSILDLGEVQRETGIRRWEDTIAWTRYRQHPATDALPALCELAVSHIRAVLGLTRKVLVVDLDNTLWKGVIGEDGLHGIGVGPGTPEGEAHLALQRYLLDLKSRGVILAVCSKNNPEDAKLPFQEHASMALRLEDFASFYANWDDKVTNLRAIARDLSLGLDSFVFLDDNPLEREWVRSQLPGVAVVEAGSSVFHFVRELDRGRYFQALALSAEDLARAEQYRIEAQREGLRSTAASLDEFLQQLQLEARVESVGASNLARVTQLINKTNQFNLTTRRYTEAQVRAIAEDPAGWAGAFHMSDRMGQYGLIGAILCRPVAEFEWEVDCWLMSCRTLGRQMERFMFDRLIEAAIAKQIRRIHGVYLPTAKNGMVRELYDQFGFTRVPGTEREARYLLDVPAAGVHTATHVRNAVR